MARLALCAALLAGALFAYVIATGGEEDFEAPGGAPNIVVVMTDDQALNTFTPRAMPNMHRLLDRGGTRFPEAFATPPLCCPARAGFLTGQYPHNHGVVQNQYEQLRDNENVLPTWLDRGGYNVGLSGKFLNEYHAEEPAPGFDFWWELRGNPGYYDYEVLDGDELQSAGGERSDYSTLPVTEHAVEFVREAAGEEDPFFLWASYYAPHAFSREDEPVCAKRTAQVLARDWRRFEGAPVELPPGFNEQDVSDKPGVFRLAPLSEEEVAKAVEDTRCSLAAMHRVDDGIGRILEALRVAGAEDDTAIFFISDNGYFFGEHRRAAGKAEPYEGALRVPMGAHLPPGVLGTETQAVVSEPVATIDLAPTILELAGAEACGEDACRTMDGRSLLPLLRGEQEDWPRERSLLFELGKDCGKFASTRGGGWMYTEWYEGEVPDCNLNGRELYDLENDPHQLRNLLGDESTRSQPQVKARKDEMAELLANLRECSGVAGRDETEQPC